MSKMSPLAVLHYNNNNMISFIFSMLFYSVFTFKDFTFYFPNVTLPEFRSQAPYVT